jgi:glycolate oxidase iron-sulfur subunit
MPEPRELLKLADQCVKCGYCLPACPTFRLQHSEAESPRGRIALIQGWLSQELAPTATLFQHLDQCLECRACEAACPSLVRFGTLMDGARIIRQGRRLWWQRGPRQLWLGALSRPGWLAVFAWLGAALRHLGLWRWLEPRWPGLALMQRLGQTLRAPRQPQRLARHPQAPANQQQADAIADNRAATASQQAAELPERAPPQPPVALFLGCIARGTQGATIDAARRLLDQLGIAYQEPAQQGCCGALQRHHGFAAEADRQRARNAEAFRGLTLVGFASACVLELQGDSGIDAQEICAFLADSRALAQASPRPLPARVLVHEPCSQRLLPGGASAIYRLLGQIPDLVVEPLPGNDSCCGAAGTYLLEHPRTALALLAPKLEAVRTRHPDYVVTTNSGCALHLAGGLAAAGLDIPVLHPIELLERQLRHQGASPQPHHRPTPKTPGFAGPKPKTPVPSV